MSIKEHMKSWGVPSQYREDYANPMPSDGVAARLIRDIASAANWHEEQTQAVLQMYYADDTEALRNWDRDALAEEGEDYADGVMAALEALAQHIDLELGVSA